MISITVSSPERLYIEDTWVPSPIYQHMIQSEKDKTYKVVQIWPGLMWLVYTQISPGHIWTTLYKNRTYININDSGEGFTKEQTTLVDILMCGDRLSFNPVPYVSVFAEKAMEHFPLFAARLSVLLGLLTHCLDLHQLSCHTYLTLASKSLICTATKLGKTTALLNII
jgi:hypothetical protein